MRPKSAIEKLKPLLSAPSFTSKEAKSRKVSSETLAYYIKLGEIERIGRGIYRGITAPKIEDFKWDDLVESIQRTKGGVICLISALALYNLTEEIPRQHWIAIRNDTLHRGPKLTRVIRMRNLELGKTTLRMGEITLPIFDQERTIVDSFRYLSIEVAIKALRKALKPRPQPKISIGKLMKYAKILRCKKIEPYVIALTT